MPAFALALIACLMLAVGSRAACGGVHVAEPGHHPRGQRPPLAIGDSTMLLALYELSAAGFEANAHGCRQYAEALAILRSRRNHGTLPHMVLIALGADGSVTSGDLDQTLHILGRGRVLGLVTPRELGGGSGSDAADERLIAHRYPKRTLLLDWVRYSAGHGGWFQPDGLHLTTAGAQAFTRLLKRALGDAYPHPRLRGRLAVRIAPRARAGSAITIALRDRSGVGGLAPTLCLTPPGGRLACSRWRVPASGRTVRLPVPRPGGWLVQIRNGSDPAVERLVWVSHRGGFIRLLAAGDSEMQILDDDIAQDLGPHRVRVSSDARISTGLTNSFFFDWPAHAARQARSLRPDVTVIFIGANDGFPVRGPGGRRYGCCGAGWSAGYAALVSEMMRSYLRGRAGRVYWFLLPVPRPGNFQALFRAVNAGIRRAVARFPGRVGLIDAAAFFTPGGRYRDYMSYAGHGFVIHESDGIHLSAASDAVAARQLVLDRLREDRVIR